MNGEIRPRLADIDPDIVARFRAVLLDVVCRLLDNDRIADPAIRPLPGCSPYIVGPAVTVAGSPGDFTSAIAATAVARRGDVILVSSGDGASFPVWGGGLTFAADALGCEGVAIDGTVVDSRFILECRTPVFCRGSSVRHTTPPPAGSVNVPIVWGGVAVAPGDLVLGDRDGLCILPRDRMLAILIEAEETTARIRDSLAHMRATGDSLFDLYGGRTFTAAAGMVWVGDHADMTAQTAPVSG